MEDLEDYIVTDGLKNMTLPSPEEYDYWGLRKNRIYFIDYLIDDNYSLVELTKTIIRMNVEEMDIPKKELKPIYIFIFSYGGDIEQANYACDIFKTSRIPIVTVATGAAMSAGLLLLLAGKRRYAFEHSQLMIHEGSGSFSGTASEIEEAQKAYQRQVKQMREYIIAHSDIDDETFDKNQKKDWYLTKEEIEKYHIAKIVKKFEEIV